MNLLSRGVVLLTAFKAASSFSVGTTSRAAFGAVSVSASDGGRSSCPTAAASASSVQAPGGQCRSARRRNGVQGALHAEEDSEAAKDGDGGATESPPRNRNIFQSSKYDRPVVLLGCSGPGDELTRLAESLSAKLGGGSVAKASDGSLTADAIRAMDKTSVIVVDFADAVAEEGSADRDKLTELARTLFDYEGLLGVYVNVHPEHGQLDDSARVAKEALESNVFVPYSNYEICIKSEGVLSSTAAEGDEEGGDEDEEIREDGSNFIAADGWDGVEWELSRLIARATLPPAVPGATYTPGDVNCADITCGEHTFFLSLSFPHVLESAPYLEAMCQDVDAMEYRSDLITACDDRFELSYQLQTLRRMCRPHAVRAPRLPLAGKGGLVLEDAVPVVYTVRTAHQAGTYPDDDEGIERMFGMLEVGLRSGVEVLDVESAWAADLTDELLSAAEERYASQILGSHHVVGRESSIEEAIGYYRQCELDGRAHGAKVVLSVDDDSKDALALDAGLVAQSLCRSSGRPVVPNIALLLGEAGQYSRILNTRFTPVTHESLPFVAAPGQLTANEIMATRLIMGQLKPRKFGILGHNIAYSVSPAMHGAGFAATKLPHSYAMLDMEDVTELIESDLWIDADFGGLSVTIPHKQSIMPHMDELSDSVKDIGAMNTVIVEKDEDGKRWLRGDNTDWRGIHGPLERRLGPKKPATDSGLNDSSSPRVALILGGGGTARAAAYAARELGLDRIFWNRTPAKAEELAASFGGMVVTSLDEAPSEGGEGEGSTLGDALFLLGASVPSAVISTLPAAAGFELPQWLVERSTGPEAASSSKPVVFDVNYKPYNTPLLLQAESMGYDVIRGSEMLWEQGVGQFELWTGRTAPYRVMKAVVLDNCLPKEEEEGA